MSYFLSCLLHQDCGLKLIEVSNRGVLAVFETLRSVLHSGQVTPRVQYMIEVMFAIRKDNFKVLYIRSTCTCRFGLPS